MKIKLMFSVVYRTVNCVTSDRKRKQRGEGRGNKEEREGGGVLPRRCNARSKVGIGTSSSIVKHLKLIHLLNPSQYEYS